MATAVQHRHMQSDPSRQKQLQLHLQHGHYTFCQTSQKRDLYRNAYNSWTFTGNEHLQNLRYKILQRTNILWISLSIS